jgi:hypothetical protein
MFIAETKAERVKLRRSGIYLEQQHAAPAELNHFLMSMTINISLLTERIISHTFMSN